MAFSLKFLNFGSEFFSQKSQEKLSETKRKKFFHKNIANKHFKTIFRIYFFSVQDFPILQNFRHCWMSFKRIWHSPQKPRYIVILLIKTPKIFHSKISKLELFYLRPSYSKSLFNGRLLIRRITAYLLWGWFMKP